MIDFSGLLDLGYLCSDMSGKWRRDFQRKSRIRLVKLSNWPIYIRPNLKDLLLSAVIGSKNYN